MRLYVPWVYRACPVSVVCCLRFIMENVHKPTNLMHVRYVNHKFLLLRSSIFYTSVHLFPRKCQIITTLLKPYNLPMSKLCDKKYPAQMPQVVGDL